MMDTPNQNPSAGEQKNNPQNGGGNRHHRHRGHRGGKHHHHNNGVKKENNADLQNGESTPAMQQPNEKKTSVPANQAPQENKNNQEKGNQKPQGGDGKSNHNHNRNRNRRDRDRNRKNSQDYFRQPPREAKEEDELSLADLRAKIVLKSADGTPPAPSAEPVAEVIAPTEPTSVEIEAAPAVLEEEELLIPAPETATPILEEIERIEVVGVRFRSSGKMYYFEPGKSNPQKGEFVIVETARGPEFGEVCLSKCGVNKKDVVLPLRPIIRIASKEDIIHNDENREKEKKALEICREKIANHKLEMKLIDAQYAFDNSKLLFYFSAEGRVDFRDLVKDLASVFHTRIELRQIGIRDEARMLGGLGVCGRPLCCATFLSDFAQVSIKMAKEQNLSLNSSKISGACGRLMCCLHYEAEVYSEEIKKTPANDFIVKTEDGIGTVIGSNPLAGTVRVILKDANDATPKQYHRDTVTVIGKEKRNNNQKDSEKGE